MKQSHGRGSDHGTSDLIRIARRLFIRRRRVRPSWMPRRQSRLQRVIAHLKTHGSLRLVAGAILIIALVLVVYLPILPGSFIMDDERLVKDGNPVFTGELTPRSVWFQTDFPLTLCT